MNSITKDVLEGFKNNEPGYVYHNYIFGGGKEKLEAIEFKGGDINCIFGGLALDLRDTKLAEGINILTINTVMGGVVIYMPIDWNIILKKNNIFGSFEDHRPKSTFKPDNNRILIIESSAVFGGGEIRWNDKSSNI